MATVTTEEIQTSQIIGILSTSAQMEEEIPILDWPNEAGFQTLHEEREPIELSIIGTIPAYAAGELYRTGPGSYKIPLEEEEEFICDHWFDGFGHTHRFEIAAQDGNTKVFYNSRRANDGLIERIKKSGRYGSITFGQKKDPCIGIFGKVMSIFRAGSKTPSEVNVNVTLRPNLPGVTRKSETPEGHSTGLKSLWAASDNTNLKELDPRTLEPIGLAQQQVLHPDLKGELSCAHSCCDPETGDIFNYNLALGRSPIYRIFKTSADTGKTEILAAIGGKGIKPAYLHSFFITKDYIILCIWGAHYDKMGVKILTEQNLLDAIAPFDRSQSAKWLVVDRRNGQGLVAEFESPSFFCFHTINAWQESNADGSIDIICECVEYPNTDIIHKLYYRNMTSDSHDALTFNQQKINSIMPQLSRYRLPKIGGKALNRSRVARFPKISPSVLFARPHVGDLPTINPNFQTKESRYVYGIVNRGLSSFLDGISKLDTKVGEVLYWDNAKGHTPGEAIFVPDPEGKDEDDGVLLSVVLDGIRQSSYLLCLDAKTMKEIGRAEVGCAVGFGFHGVHVKV